MQKVSVIILHYGRIENTLECVESLQKIIVPKDAQIEIIVVDNASKINLKPQISNVKTDNIKIVKNKENLGFAGGNNVGIRIALNSGADYILILNNDTIVSKNLIEEFLKIVESNSKIGIVAAKIYFAPGFEFHKDRYARKDLGKVFWYAGGKIDWENIIGRHRGVDEVDHGQYDRIEETDFVSGCCMLVKKEVFEKIGVFDDKYFLYYEDSDLSERAKRAGYKIVYVPSAIIWHKNAGSAGGSGSELQDYYITRNRLLFGMRYAPIRSKFALVRESFLLMFRGRYWQKRGVMDFFRHKLGRGSFEI